MYLDESVVAEAPPGGWPAIDVLRDMDKTSEVLELLRHLPYIRREFEDTDPEGSPRTHFADWPALASLVADGEEDCDDLRLVTEGEELCEILPPHVFSLTNGDGAELFLVDTKLGIILWHQCPDEIKFNPSREPVFDDPYDYLEGDEEQAGWRGDSRAWSIPDFFEILKDQFRELNYVPISSRTVKDATKGDNEMLELVRGIYREHGWPDLDCYRKRECLKAVKEALKERYPGEEGSDVE